MKINEKDNLKTKKKDYHVDIKSGSLEPLVSICLITFNHEKYIEQAVDSILAQKMEFAFELLIADDASTDCTQQILKEKYSNRKSVRLILRETNANGKNSYLTLQEARGKYIYLCQGDDYWIGENGLQQLVNWMESHENYAGVSGRRVTLSEKTGLMIVGYDQKTNGKAINLNDYLNNKVQFDLNATLYKNFYHDEEYDYRFYLACPRVGDLTMGLYILLHGDIFQLDNLVGVYRADRLKDSGAYNAITTPKRMFEEHMALISNLHMLIHKNLDYSKMKRRYADWYIASFVSTYEFLQKIFYLRKKIGIRMTVDCLKTWIKNIKQ